MALRALTACSLVNPIDVTMAIISSGGSASAELLEVVVFFEGGTKGVEKSAIDIEGHCHDTEWIILVHPIPFANFVSDSNCIFVALHNGIFIMGVA